MPQSQTQSQSPSPGSTQQPDALDLKGRRLILTGGTTGIGRAALKLLAGQGARIVTCGRNEPELREALAHAGGQTTGLVADMARQQDVDRLFAQADKDLGGLDALICNAAIGVGPLGDAGHKEWRYAVEANLLGYMACTRAGLDRLRGKGGQIILVGSISAEIRSDGESTYSATKAGIQAFGEALHREEGRHDIRVTVIEPGSVATPMQEATSEEQKQGLDKGEMLPDVDIAESIRWVLVQPARVNVSLLRIEPIRQKLKGS